MLWPYITLASAAAASYAGYATMAPASQLYGRTLTHGSDPGQMALTFDDGPNDPHTLHLLDVLAKHNARATFFLIGKYVRQRPDIVRAIAAAGHEIGNHTESHPNLILVSAARLRQELSDCNKALEDALGTKITLFRPPFGGRRPNVLRTARGMGLSPVMWSVTGYDWSAKSAAEIVGKVNRQGRLPSQSTGRDCPAARWRTPGLWYRPELYGGSYPSASATLLCSEICDCFGPYQDNLRQL